MNNKKTIKAGCEPSLDKIVRFLITPFLILIFLDTVRLAWVGLRENDAWKVGDWLINYQGGFVRRGLIGEFILSTSSWSGFEPALFVVILQSLCYLLLFLFAGMLLRHQKSLQLYVLLIFSPFIFTFQLHDGGFRKEILYFALLAFFIWTTQIRNKKWRQALIRALLLFYPVLILSHELLAIFLPYLLIVYFRQEGVSKKTTLSAALMVLPSFFVFLIVLANPGTTEQVQAICTSLGEHAPDSCDKDGGIESLSWTTAFAFKKVKYSIAHLSYIPLYIFVIFMSLMALLPIGYKVKSHLMTGISLLLFLVSIAGTLLLFFFAGDWGRFIYIHLVSIFLVTLHRTGEKDLFGKANKENISLTQWLLGGSGRSKYFEHLIVLLFVCCYAMLWHIPYAGGNPFFSFILQGVFGLCI